MEQKIIFTSMNIGLGVLVVMLTILLLKRAYGGTRTVSRTGTKWESFLGEFRELVYAACTFQTTAGGRVGDYVDTDGLMQKPELLDETILGIVEQLSPYLKKYPSGKVCFIEKDSGPVGMLAYAGLTAIRICAPISVIRPRREVLKMAIEGNPIGMGDKVILVQDVLTTSFQVLRAGRVLGKLGAQVVAVVVLVDRGEMKDTEFSQMGIDVSSFIELAEIQKIKTGSACAAAG